MRGLFVVAVIAVVAWLGYSKYQARTSEDTSALVSTETPTREAVPASFTCDGRTHCSQMTSCAEATFFLNNCPNTKMDGDHDGIPCEQQWCTQ